MGPVDSAGFLLVARDLMSLLLPGVLFSWEKTDSKQSQKRMRDQDRGGGWGAVVWKHHGGTPMAAGRSEPFPRGGAFPAEPQDNRLARVAAMGLRVGLPAPPPLAGTPAFAGTCLTPAVHPPRRLYREEDCSK